MISNLRRYAVFRIKLIELLHLTALTRDISSALYCPTNTLGHEARHFSDTLYGLTISSFISITDPNGTDVKPIWLILFPKHSRAIERIWTSNITPGWKVMKAFRDSAGFHGDKPQKYFAARLSLATGGAAVIKAPDSFHSLSACLHRRESKELPEFLAESEQLLLGVEIRHRKSFNRRWLREMGLIRLGAYHKKFR